MSEQIEFEGRMSDDGECSYWSVDHETWKRLVDDDEIMEEAEFQAELATRPGMPVQSPEEWSYLVSPESILLERLGHYRQPNQDQARYKVTLKLEKIEDE